MQVYDVMVEYNNYSSLLAGLVHFILHLLNLSQTAKTSHVLSMGSWVALRTSCINSINTLRGATILRQRSLICLNFHTY